MGNIAVIGFGCAGYHAVKTLRENGYTGGIDVYSDTGEAPCNPMLTTYYVSEKIKREGMYPFGSLEEICAQFDLHILCESEVTRLHAKERVVEMAQGCSRPYDDIVICTGAVPVVPPFARGLKNNAYTMRTAADARALEAKLASGGVRTAVVVGGQMVGIKVVELLWKRNIKTLLVDMAPQIFPVSACERVAQVIQQRLSEQGIEQRYSCALAAVEETENGIRSTLADGTVTESDIIVFCSGIRANVPFVEREEIPVGRAVTVDLRMRTGAEHIYACGDCCEVADIQTGEISSIGLWANAAVQGQIAARNILGEPVEYQGNLIHNITHFMDMDFISIGNCHAQGEHTCWAGDSWQMEAILDGDGKPLCINILDNARVSGALKALLIKRFKSPEAPLGPAARLQLERSGLPRDVIELLGGNGMEE